jgi:ribosomal-protein-alanine N-acetyltransferase
MVGDICMYGEADERGQVEIGYGIYEEFQNKGYMTEIVRAMTQWIATQRDIKFVIASTEKFNIPSFRVLEKNGFIKIGETDKLVHWKLPVNA